MQASIGPAATPDLVMAVAQAGALGTLAASWADPDGLRGHLRLLRSQLDRAFCVNLVLAFDQRERTRLVLDEGARIISFSWGVDAELIRLAHDGRATVLVQVADVPAAVAAADAGADVLIAQGAEAGGHVQGATPTLDLVAAVRAASRLPLVAAGGIGDGPAAAKAMAAGADAVACGTAFLAAAEADVHPVYLDHLVRARAEDTSLTTAFDGGWPDAAHRVIRNSTLAHWEVAGGSRDGARPGEGEVVATRGAVPIHRYDDAQPTRDTTGDVEAMAMYAGTSAAAVTRGERAADIVGRLAASLA
jgi:nitronate monooxygenase